MLLKHFLDLLGAVFNGLEVVVDAHGGLDREGQLVLGEGADYGHEGGGVLPEADQPHHSAYHHLYLVAVLPHLYLVLLAALLLDLPHEFDALVPPHEVGVHSQGHYLFPQL